MSHQRSISIGLCTYNGSKYLKEQLHSYLNQSIPPNELVVCDDCSNDDSIDIIQSFSKIAPFRVRIFRNDNNIGVTNNFSKVISLCEYKYIAISDQDDIWQPDKLETSYTRMLSLEKKYGSQVPILIHSDLTVINEKSDVISDSFMKYLHLRNIMEKPLKYLLMQNFVTGCTCFFNSALAQEASPIPEKAALHDWWLALIAAARGMIAYVPEPKVLYRHHGKNTIGAKGLREIIRTLSMERLNNQMNRLLNQANELRNHLLLHSEPVPRELELFISSMRKGGLKSAYCIFSSGIRTQRFGINLLYLLIIMRKEYLRL